MASMPERLETVHLLGARAPATIFSARPRQPGSPQAPQLEPGSMVSTCSMRGSSATLRKR